MGKLAGWLIVFLLLIVNPTTTGSQAASFNSAVFQPGSERYIVNHQEQAMDAITFIEQGRVWVPLRYLAYACGITTEGILWDPVTQSARLTLGDRELTLQVGSKQLVGQEGPWQVDTAPQIIGDRVYLPARWVASYFGYGVDWDAEKRAVLIYAFPAEKPQPPPAVDILLVNKQLPLPADYSVGELVDFQGFRFAAPVQAPLQELFAAAARQGFSLRVTSGYRSAAEQQAVFQNRASKQGLNVARATVAPVGHSEHQTGLAVDIAGTIRAYDWLAANSWQYGFILRYPKGKEAITGYAYEPWHFRYVGVPIASFMHYKGIATLEEFVFDYAGG